eukprot:14964200-Alexandrium_andersonii.AAC.1
MHRAVRRATGFAPGLVLLCSLYILLRVAILLDVLLGSCWLAPLQRPPHHPPAREWRPGPAGSAPLVPIT